MSKTYRVLRHTPWSRPFPACLLPASADADMCPCGFSMAEDRWPVVLSRRLGGFASLGHGHAPVPLHGRCFHAFRILKVQGGREQVANIQKDTDTLYHPFHPGHGSAR